MPRWGIHIAALCFALLDTIPPGLAGARACDLQDVHLRFEERLVDIHCSAMYLIEP